MRFMATLALLLAAVSAFAVPPGFRYVGSRVVSGGQVIYWYWNADHVELDPSRTTFVAHMFARAAGINQERPYVAIVRCDTRSYRDVQTRGTYQPIDDGEPIEAVWRAGCDKGVALEASARAARLGIEPPAAAPAAAPSPEIVAQAPRAAQTPAEAADPRRADACVRFAETRGAPAGDATITNACAYPVEVTVCYKGGGKGAYDCPTPPRGRVGDSLRAGITHVLPEYRHGRNRGINVVACRGEPGSVFPKLDESGKSGCF